MPAITRQGDGTLGVCNPGLPCCAHTRHGTNQIVSPNVFVNDQGTHRLNDTGPCNCPHGGTFASVQGSGSVFVNGEPVTRIGDTTVCQSCGKSGNHVVGSPNVFAGG